FFSSRRRHTRFSRDWSSDVCSSDLRTVQCVVLGTEAEGLDYVPYPGELGQRIYEHVSKEGWQRWLRHQTMLINEYRLTPIEPKEIGRASCREGGDGRGGDADAEQIT